MHRRRCGSQHDHFVPTQPPQNHCLHAMGGFRLMIKSRDCSTIFFLSKRNYYLLMQRCCGNNHNTSWFVVVVEKVGLDWIVPVWCVFWFCMVLVGNVTCSNGGGEHRRPSCPSWLGRFGNLWILVATDKWQNWRPVALILIQFVYIWFECIIYLRIFRLNINLKWSNSYLIDLNKWYFFKKL